MYLPAFGINVLPVLPFNHAFGALGPLLAAFILKGIEEGKNGISSLLRSMFRTNITFLLIAITSPFILLLAAAAISYSSGSGFFDIFIAGKTNEFPAWGLTEFFIYNVIFFGFGEETGWKGYALPRLQSKYSALTSSIIFTGFWAVWHIPLFFYRPGYTGMGIALTAGWLLSLLTGSILLTWLFNSSGGSILVCAVFHAAIDIVFIPDFADRNIINYLGMLITVWGIITVLVFGYRNLSWNGKICIDHQAQ
jgi:membrane protease YdiL (CAAX protease family)